MTLPESPPPVPTSPPEWYGWPDQPVPEAPARTMRWGCGDIGFGLAAMLFLSLVIVLPAAIVMAAGAGPDATTAEIDLNSPVIVLAGLAGTWGGLGGWAIIASKWRGLGTLREDFQYWFKLPHDIGLGLAGGVVAILAGAIVAAIEQALKVDAISNGQFLEANKDSNRPAFIVMGLAAAIGAPVVEELFFRGLAFTAIQRRLDTGWAVVLSTVLFGALHYQSAPTAAAAAFLVLHITTFGLVLGGLRAWTGRCGPGVVAHMAINGFGVALVAFGVG